MQLLLTGRRSARLAAAALLILSSTPASAEDIVVHFRTSDPSAVRAIGTVTIRPTDARTSQPIVIETTVPGSLRTQLSRGHYVVELESHEWWIPSQIVSVQSSDSFELALRRMAVLEGSIAGPAKSDSLLVRFSESKQPSISGEARCATKAQKFRCHVPEGTLDIRLALPGHVPHYRWGIAANAGSETNLGAFKLIAGASLSGSVQVEEGALKGVTLQLTHQSESPKTIAIDPAPNGFFVVGPLRPGNYMLSGMRKGLISATRGITIREGLEAQLNEPLLLAKPRRIEVFLFPLTNPTGGSWIVQLSRVETDGKPAEVSLDRASPDGSWTADRLAPGDYELSVAPEGGPVWHTERVKITEPVTSLHLAVNGLRFRGTVRFADRPLSAQVIFGGEHGSPRIPWRSDEQGEFKGYLPRTPDDGWIVAVKSEEPPIASTLTNIKPRLDAASGEAIFDLVVPAQSISGEVVDEKGAAVPKATVNISGRQLGRLMQIDADETGEFHVHGLEAGEYQISATAYLKESDTAVVELSARESEPAHVRLEVKPYRQWSGKVTAPDGRPVADARVFAAAVDVPITMALPARTDRDGRFVVLVPAGARLFDVSVAPKGYAYSFFRQPLSDHLNLIANPRGGTIVVDSPNDPKNEPFLWHSGSVRSAYSLFSSWSAQFEDSPPDRMRVRIPQMEPGEYTVCLLPSSVDHRNARPSGQCRLLYLTPYGEELVRFDAPASQQH